MFCAQGQGVVEDEDEVEVESTTRKVRKRLLRVPLTASRTSGSVSSAINKVCKGGREGGGVFRKNLGLISINNIYIYILLIFVRF